VHDESLIGRSAVSKGGLASGCHIDGYQKGGCNSVISSADPSEIPQDDRRKISRWLGARAYVAEFFAGRLTPKLRGSFCGPSGRNRTWPRSGPVLAGGFPKGPPQFWCKAARKKSSSIYRVPQPTHRWRRGKTEAISAYRRFPKGGRVRRFGQLRRSVGEAVRTVEAECE